MQLIVAVIFIAISIVILILAIKNVYRVRLEINSIKNHKTKMLILANIVVAILFIIGYLTYAALLLLKIDFYNNILVASLFCLSSIFLLVASIVTHEMGRLLFRIDKIRKLDAMTKVYNHLQIKNIIAKEFVRCRRYQRTASLIMFDINKFKSINDLYGHLAGDKIILDLVATIKAECRTTDILGRYGGDEFILLMPETTLEAAQKFADRIVQIIDTKKIFYEGNIITYSISCGISAVNFNHSSHENWLRITDKELYKIKSKNGYQVDK